MASAKKTRLPLGGGSSKKLSIERLWLINEVAITDLPDSKRKPFHLSMIGVDLSNAIEVVRGGEKVILMTENVAGKRLWLQQIRKTQQAQTDLPPAPSSPSPVPVRVKSPKDTAGSHRRRPSNISSVVKKSMDAPFPDVSPEKFGGMLGLLDELNEDTDKCHYDKAVEIVDKIKYEIAQMDPRASSLHILNQRLQNQVTKLANYLYHEISDLIIGKEAMSKHIQRLVVLGFPDEAREKFLAARSDFIKERTKYRDTNGTLSFVDICGMWGTASADWYVSSFKDHTMTAGSLAVVSDGIGFVFWVKLEINHYVNMIVKQVFKGNDIDFRLIGDCVSIARRQCSSLRSIGLDFNFYLDDQLMPHINHCLLGYQSQCEEKVKEALSEDDFLEDKVEAARQQSDFNAHGVAGITISTVQFYRIVVDFLNDVEPLLLDETSEVLVTRLTSLIENYATGLLQRTYSTIPATANLNIIANLSFISSSFLPSLTRQLEERFNRPFADAARLFARLDATIGAMERMFAEQTAKRMVPELSLASEGNMENEADLSPWLVSLLPLYGKISRDSGDRRTSLMPSLLECILAEMTAMIEKSTHIGSQGLQQLLLDLHFLLLASAPFLSQNESQLGVKLSAMALEKYGKGSSSLKADNWYEGRAQELQRRYPIDFGQ
ncbi:hypothetical protein PSACC_02710 [Paramicrosporidium saccamoebae]|uniref:Exocyst complex component EXO84 n=1 Tax=Paramicrosporidium saccamoebae TaxID=1246581 RepID=A0A2H9TI82_9FUNG|nr:hypothetical protein PSACC_02710 [Paramicrosporidium saccamoebae]